MSMFCFQCQEAAKGTGCTKVGVCGKKDDVARMQDLLIFVLKGISYYAVEAEEIGVKTDDMDRFVYNGLFKTITNANFDKSVFVKDVTEGLKLRDKLKKSVVDAGADFSKRLPDCAVWTAGSEAEYDIKAATVGVLATENEDVRSLRELLTYGLKGIAAYAEHAANLGYENPDIFRFIYRGLASTVDDSLDADNLTALVLECGKYGVDVMALLDKANTATYGNPEISKVNIGTGKNPGILISGHDLKDMEQLLEQTEGTGVDVYTHSEMLPANYYPAFKNYTHFIGNYGNAWWKQNTEFESFNGPVLFTTNCITPPKESYKDRVFTTGASGFEGVKHI